MTSTPDPRPAYDSGNPPIRHITVNGEETIYINGWDEDTGKRTTIIPPASPVTVGTSVIDGWSIVEEIGIGGSAIVYRGIKDGRVGAVKLAYPTGIADRVSREIVLNGLMPKAHPHLLPWIGDGTYEGWRYLITEYAAGGTVQDVIDAGNRFAVRVAGRIIRQAALGVSASGCIHRDLKPHNIFLVPDAADGDGFPQRAMVGDWGCARHLDDLSSEMAMTAGRRDPSQIFGTLVYMAPEQTRNMDLVDARSDVCSLAIAWVVMVHGEYKTTEPLPLSEIDLHGFLPVPEEFGESYAEVIRKATQKDPAHRYADCAAFAVAIGDVLGIGAEERQKGGMMGSITGFFRRRRSPPPS